ncbi:hypothetical protein PtA15_9A415 [Puccinia triticina]|uniref:Uracil-DNA glycosylase-like domain-containing protein n=1 Tax=Puccinia triticina TaxID=208348 RepID=A0ABY7CVC3_9BASI|nr:uncharacterized protein PtA15_9A415 [Puccinia triticina]WAQ88288.1 hypothetical protein PtA15_9A415 [Puccinia triticina]
MAPSAIPKPDKRQRSIAQMFGAKDPSFGVTSKTSSPSVSSTTTSSARVTAPAPKSKGKTSNVRTLVTTGRLARVSYQKLQPVDSESYRDSLSAEFKELLALEIDPEHGLGSSYLHVLRAQLTQQYFLDLKRFLIAEGLNQPRNNIYPPAKNIYHWSRATPLDQIRVVIIGQDPYHGPGQAHGLSFSVPKGIPIPGSLRNIYQELKSEYPEFKAPGHGTLRSWAESGVLLLNTSLTVKKSSAGSHSNKGWEQFTDAVVDAIDLYGGLGLLKDIKPTEADQTIEPVSKRIKLDHPTSSEASPPETKGSQSTTSLLDPNPPTPVSVSTLKASTSDADHTASVPDSDKAPHSDKITAENPDHQPSSDKKLEESQPASPDINLAESTTTPKLSQVAGRDDDAPSSILAEDPRNQDLPGFGKGVVFLCWGKWAADRVARLSESKHLILKSAHPSPLSAHRGFLGNNHFKLANEWLEKKYGKSAKINWCDLKP